MIEDGGLVLAQKISVARVADVARVAGMENARVVVQQKTDSLANEHIRQGIAINLICQIK